MNRRLKNSVIIYNILFLSFLGLLFIITKIYDKEIPSNFYDHTIVEHRYIEILIFFAPIYLEYSLGLCCKFNRGFVIGCEILAFLLLKGVMGYFFIERVEAVNTYLWICGVLVFNMFFCLYIEFNTELKEYLLTCKIKDWCVVEIPGSKYNGIFKKISFLIFGIYILILLI